jgi:hypothetical protein
MSLGFLFLVLELRVSTTVRKCQKSACTLLHDAMMPWRLDSLTPYSSLVTRPSTLVKRSPMDKTNQCQWRFLLLVSSIRVGRSFSLERCRLLDAKVLILWRRRGMLHHQDDCLLCQVCSFLLGNKNLQKNLSRAEKRKLIRELKRKQRKGIEMPSPERPNKKKSWLNHFRLHPQYPGGSSNFQWDISLL